MSVTSYFVVNEPKAQALMSGRLRITLSERVKGRAGGNRDAPSSEANGQKRQRNADQQPQHRMQQQHQNHQNQQQQQQQQHRSLVSALEAFGSDDDIECPSMAVNAGGFAGARAPGVAFGVLDGYDGTCNADEVVLDQREQVMLVMLGQLNSAFRERLDDVNRSVFNTKLQAELAKQPLRNELDLQSTTVNGFSKHMKEKYGKFLIQAVKQVDTFLDVTNNVEALTLDSFALDVDAIFGKPIVTMNDMANAGGATPVVGGADWGDDSDDDWAIEPTWAGI